MIKNLPVPSCSLLHVKNCVLFIDISVEFALDSCVEISKLETQQKMTETRSQNFTAIHRSSEKFHGGICGFKTFCMRIVAG